MVEITKTNRFVIAVTTSGEDWTGHFKEEPDIQEIEQAVFLDIKELEESGREHEIDRARNLRIMLEVVRIADLQKPDIYVGATWVGKITIKTEEIFGRVKESMPGLKPDKPFGGLTSKPLNPCGEIVLDAANPTNNGKIQSELWRGAEPPLVLDANDEENF